MAMHLGIFSDAGLVREENEDSFYASEGLMVVADGMGGHNAGEVASSMAVRRLVEMLPDVSNLPDSLVDAVQAANTAVYEAAQSSELNGMGTTLTCAIVKDGSVYIAHVGDSRGYLVRQNNLFPLTVDHTIVAELVRSGNITDDEAKTHPHRHILTRALGTSPHLMVDVQVRQLSDGDVVMLCTDGLTGVVDKPEIINVLHDSRNLQEAAEKLVQLANSRGGPDNITVVLGEYRR